MWIEYDIDDMTTALFWLVKLTVFQLTPCYSTPRSPLQGSEQLKEVSYKICHIIYPAKHVLERFKLNISYTCGFCGQEKNNYFTFIYIFFSLYSRKIILEGFWILY